MNDMSPVIEPKSDQLNADDFMAGPQTFTIESVDIKPGAEQPVSIKLAGEARVWRCCKSMSRVLVAAWGADAKAYTGRSVTLYRDPSVKWGGLEVGGIRVSHMSDMDRTMVLALTATKGNRKPFTVKPMANAPRPVQSPGVDLASWADMITERVPGYATVAALKADWDVHELALRDALPDRFKELNRAVAGRAGELTADE